MDIIGAIGYSGQDITFLGQDNFGYITGKSIYIVGLAQGPKEMIWRPEGGISTIASHILTHRLAIAPEIAKFDVEIIDFLAQQSPILLKNPSSAKIVDMAFSRDGEYVFAISSSLDSKVFAWHLRSRSLTFVSDLPANFASVAVNPADWTKFILSGEEGLYMGSIIEIMGVSSIKYDKIVLDDIQITPQNEEGQPNVDETSTITSSSFAPTSVKFALWAPFNRIFIGTKSGLICEVNAIDFTVKIRAHMANIAGSDQQLNQHALCVPLCGAISSSNLVVGTSTGLVLWYPVFDIEIVIPVVQDLESEPLASPLCQPLQSTQLTSEVNCLQVDFLYATVLAGTSLGAIMKFPLDIAEINIDDGDDDAAENVEVDSILGKSLDDENNQMIAAVQITTSQAGAVLCCKSITLPVLSLTETSPKTSAVYCNIFMTGSHSGLLSFWRQPSIDSEEIVKDCAGVPGIRRSLPRVIKVITSMNVGSGASAPSITHFSSTTSITSLSQSQSFVTSAVASLDYLPFNQKTGFGLIMVGTMNGYFESWKICAYEAEEDEEIVLPDEEDATVNLKFVKYFSKKIFRSTISLLTSSSEEKKYYNIFLGSIFEERMFFLKIPTDFANGGVDLVCAVNLHNLPSSCVWNGRSFWMGCQNGTLCSFTPHKNQKNKEKDKDKEKEREKEEKDTCECDPHAYWEASLPSISNVTSSNKGENLIITSPSNDFLRVFSVQLESTSTSLSSTYTDEPLRFRNPYRHSIPHSDLVVCITTSTTGVLVAAGCVDGSVHIWNFATNNEFKLVAKVNLHSQAVLSLSFSIDSSLLMSCGADGSVFISTVGEPNRFFSKTALGDSKFYDKVQLNDDLQASMGHKADHAAGNTANSTAKSGLPPDSVTWHESKQAEALEELKRLTAAKVNVVSTTIDEISNRLKNILERNNTRNDDIEKLERTELVVDLDGRDKILKENEELLESTRSLYSKKNLFHEVVASRVKETCWDSMDEKERQILPFNTDDKLFLSSFSIKNCTEKEKRRLTVTKRMRAIEIRTQRAHEQGVTHRVPTYEASVRTSWAKSIHGFASAISWIANDGSRWPSQNVITTLLRKEKGINNDVNELNGKLKEKFESSSATLGLGMSMTIEGPGSVDLAGAPMSGRFNGNNDDDDDISMSSVFDADREMDEYNIFNLLYTPETVRTQTQKRTQIVFLLEVARLLRVNFNQFFEELIVEKEDVIAAIESRNFRLESILLELKQKETLFTPKLLKVELKGSVIVITDDELLTRPYESDHVTIAKTRDDELKKKLISINETENSKERALYDMMNGILEVRRDVFADFSSIPKPLWMEDLIPNDMTESQLKELEIFELKVKNMQEEQLKYKKSLEQEMKKLKSETTEACKNFDEKVANVARIKVLVQREILTQELYIARLGLTIAKRDQSWGTLKNTEKKIEVARKERSELRVRTEKFTFHVEAMRNNLNVMQEEERALDKTFKRDFQTLCNNNFDQDSLKIFADLYRRREYAASPDDEDDGSQDPDGEESELINGSQRGSFRRSKAQSSKMSKKNNNGMSKRTKNNMNTSRKNTALNNSKKNGIGAGSRIMRQSKNNNNGRSTTGGKERLGPMQEAAQALKNAQMPEANDKDPFFIDLLMQEKLLRIAEAKIPLLMSLNIESDCPENFIVDQYTWSKLQDLRNIRIEKEIASKRMSIEYNELKRKLDDLINVESALVTLISSLRQTRDEILNYLESIETNLEVLVCLKQGQDEVDKDAVVTEYDDAVLVPTVVVDKYNSRIKELGKEKVSVLSRIKQYRKKINLTEWNSNHLMMGSKHMEEYFTDLQLLRVTRELQQVIRDGSNPEQTKERLDKVAVRRDFLQKDSDSKAAKMRFTIDALHRQLQDREDESVILESKIRDLKIDVAMRQNVKNSTEIARGMTTENLSDASGQKMKKIVARKQMLDAARQQAEEADFLRQELDRLRQRTFPSFVKAAKDRVLGTNGGDER